MTQAIDQKSWDTRQGKQTETRKLGVGGGEAKPQA